MIGKKAYVAMALANALLLGLVACTFLFFNARVNTKLEEVTKRDQAVLRNLNEIDSCTLVTGQATRSVFIDPQDTTARESYQAACDRFAKAYGAALALSTGDVKGKLASIKAGWDEDDGLKRQAQALAGDGKKDEAAALLTTRQATANRDLRAAIGTAIEAQETRQRMGVASCEAAIRTGTAAALAATLAAFALFSLFLVLSYKAAPKEPQRDALLFGNTEE